VATLTAIVVLCPALSLIVTLHVPAEMGAITYAAEPDASDVVETLAI
jgi:hypothetical protein